MSGCFRDETGERSLHATGDQLTPRNSHRHGSASQTSKDLHDTTITITLFDQLISARRVPYATRRIRCATRESACMVCWNDDGLQKGRWAGR